MLQTTLKELTTLPKPLKKPLGPKNIRRNKMKRKREDERGRDKEECPSMLPLLHWLNDRENQQLTGTQGRAATARQERPSVSHVTTNDPTV